MKKSIISIGLLTLCTNLHAQTRDCSLVGRWAHGAAYTGVLEDGILYYGNGGYMDMADVSDIVSHPTLLGRWLAPGPVHALAVRGDYAYLANGSAGLRIVNISDPANAVETGSVPVNYQASDVGLNSDYAYVADKNYGLRIVDIRNPADPVETAFCPVKSAQRLAYAGGYVYLSAEHYGLFVIDVSDPAAPVKTDSVYIYYVYDLDVNNNRLYAVSGDSLSLLSLSDPAHPVMIESIGEGGYKRGVFAENDIAYICEPYAGFLGYDVSDPENPSELFRYALNEEHAFSSFVTGGTAYVAMEYFGIKIIDVSDPAALQPLGEIPTGAFSRNVAVDGHYAYVAQGYAGLRILDTSNPADPVEIAWLDAFRNVSNVTLHGTSAFLCQNSAGPTVILDISNPADPDSLGQIGTDNLRYSNDCKIVGNTAFLAMGSRGLGIADISDPAHPSDLSRFDTPGFGHRLDVSGQYAYVADDDSLLIIDISDPANPARAAAIAGRKNVYDVVIRQPYAFVADYYEGLTVIDISDPLRPVIAGSKDTQRAYGIVLKDDIAYIADYGGGMTMLDISDPANPAFLGRYDTPSAAEGVAVDDRGYIYVTDNEDGIYIVQYDGPDSIEPIRQTPDGFQLTSNFPNPFNPSTAVSYTIPAKAQVELNVYNIHGQFVARLDRGVKEAGRYTAVWTGIDSANRQAPAGVYLCRLKSGDWSKTVRMVLVK